MVPSLIELRLPEARFAGIVVQSIAGLLIDLRPYHQAVAIDDEECAVFVGVFGVQFANMQPAGQAARQRQQHVALTDRRPGVAYQHPQPVARVCQQETTANLLDSAVAVQPALEVRAVEADVAVCALKQRECMCSCFFGGGEVLECPALRDGDRRPRLFGWEFGVGVVHGETPR